MDGQAVAVPGAPKEAEVRLSTSRIATWCMYGLMAFPLVDYTLRLRGVHPLGLVWDKVVLIALLILTLVRYVGGYRPAWFTWQKFAVWFMVFGLGMMFAGFADPLIAIQGYRIDVYYIFYVFFIPFVVGPKDVPKLLHIMAAVGILIAVDGIYQYITRVPIPYGWVAPGEHVRTRVFSVLQSPNIMGSYMALMLPLTIGLAVYESHKWRKWLYVFGAFCCAATLVFTYTRGAWLAFAAAALIVAVLFDRRLFVVLILLAVIGFFLPPIHHRLSEFLSPVYWIQSAEGGRVERWLTAFDKMASNPLFGVGVGHYGGAVSSIYHSGIYSDNYYAKTLGETGLVGLTLFMMMHLALIRDLVKNVVRKMTGRSKYVALGGVTGLIAVLIHNFTENVFEQAPMLVAYFGLATLLLIWARGQNESEEDTHGEA